MVTIVSQPSLADSLCLIGWRLKRNAELQARQNENNFECEIEPSTTSYAAIDSQTIAQDNTHSYVDLCLEVDSIDLNDDYDPYEIFMKTNTRRTINGQDRSPLVLLPSSSSSSSSSTQVKNHRHYNFAMDDTSIKYPLAITSDNRNHRVENGSQVDVRSTKRVTFSQLNDDVRETVRNNKALKRTITKRFRPSISTNKISDNSNNNNNDDDGDDDDDDDDDIAPTVTEMDMLDDNDDETELITKSSSSPIKLSTKSSYIGNNLLNSINDESHLQDQKRIIHQQNIKRVYDNENDNRKRTRIHDNEYPSYYDIQQKIRVPARRGRPPSQHYQEDSKQKDARIIAQFEEKHGLKLGEMHVFAPKLRLRISSVNVKWINLPPIPNFPNKVHDY